MNVPDFIGIYEDAVPDLICDKVINAFDVAEKIGFTRSRPNKSVADDSVTFAGHLPLSALPDSGYPEILSCLWECYRNYSQKYSVALDATDEHRIFTIKVQKTEPGQGYHVWHHENDTRSNGDHRILAFTAYLNDVEDGGETEFLYYSKRVKPKKGTVCIFPAGFTHLHRGNPPLSGVKYIATGWFEL